MANYTACNFDKFEIQLAASVTNYKVSFSGFNFQKFEI